MMGKFEHALQAAHVAQTLERHVAGDYTGNILLWDIDKTYLDTHFSSWSGLAAIPFELAVDKVPIPGAVPLLRALRRGVASPTQEEAVQATSAPYPSSAQVPLFFVSGSPPILRQVLERRMTLDGVEYDGISLKNQWGLLKSGRPKELFHQVGYKLAALLGYWRHMPSKARWLLFGDDVENDAETFLVFGEVCAGLRGLRLERRLTQMGCSRTAIHSVLALCEDAPIGEDPIEWICIHMASKKPLAKICDPRLIRSENYIQAALFFAHHGKIEPQAVASVAAALREAGYTQGDITRSAEYACDQFALEISWLRWCVA